jgi:hypothetical protein
MTPAPAAAVSTAAPISVNISSCWDIRVLSKSRPFQFWVDAMDHGSAAPAPPGNPTLDELRGEGLKSLSVGCDGGSATGRTFRWDQG